MHFNGFLELNQAWVTLAQSNLDAFQSILLANSLKQVLTTRKIIILISENVTCEMR